MKLNYRYLQTILFLLYSYFFCYIYNIIYNMSIQIFKNKIPNNYLFDLLEKICVKTKEVYIINNISFKKGMYNNLITDFFELIRKYYHISKRKYLDKTLTYNSFITIVRQICKFNQLTYKNEIKYDRSTYEIIYYITAEPKELDEKEEDNN